MHNAKLKELNKAFGKSYQIKLYLLVCLGFLLGLFLQLYLKQL
jgi:hypothetical protein